MDLKEIGCVGTDWIHLAQDRVKWRASVNTVMRRFPNWWIARRFVVGREKFLKCDFLII
jgi:hypothetical protein